MLVCVYSNDGGQNYCWQSKYKERKVALIYHTGYKNKDAMLLIMKARKSNYATDIFFLILFFFL